MSEIEYVPIRIAKEDYQPEPRMIDGSDFRLKENNQCKGVPEILVDYLMKEFDRRITKEIEESYNVASSSN